MNKQQTAHTPVSPQAQHAIQVLKHAAIANELMLKKGVSSRRLQSSGFVSKKTSPRLSTSRPSVPIYKGGSNVSEDHAPEHCERKQCSLNSAV